MQLAGPHASRSGMWASSNQEEEVGISELGMNLTLNFCLMLSQRSHTTSSLVIQSYVTCVTLPYNTDKNVAL